MKKASVTFVMSVRSSVRIEQIDPHWTDFHKIWYLNIFRNLSRKFKVHYNLTTIMVTLHEADRYTFVTTSRSLLLRITNVSDENCRETRKAHFMFCNWMLFENRAVCEIMWKNAAVSDRPQMTIWRMPIVCWITKATDTHSEYVVLSVFSLHQWLHERSSVLRYTYGTCRVNFILPSGLVP
jgi:hypothetical protein